MYVYACWVGLRDGVGVAWGMGGGVLLLAWFGCRFDCLVATGCPTYGYVPVCPYVLHVQTGVQVNSDIYIYIYIGIVKIVS